MAVKTSALALLLGLFVTACGPISMQSSERECYEAALAMAQVSDATLANARSNIDGRASEGWGEALASAHKWRMRACGR